MAKSGGVMSVEKIRNMSDVELRRFLNEVSKVRNTVICSKCGVVVSSKERKIVNVAKQFQHKYYKTKQRQLCSLCESCYKEVLDFIGIEDIDWSALEDDRK